MREVYVGLGECNPVDMTIGTKIKMQRAFSAGKRAYGWAPQTFLLLKKPHLKKKRRKKKRRKLVVVYSVTMMAVTIKTPNRNMNRT